MVPVPAGVFAHSHQQQGEGHHQTPTLIGCIGLGSGGIGAVVTMTGASALVGVVVL